MEEGGRGGKAISWHNEACFAAATRNSFPEEEEGEEEEEEEEAEVEGEEEERRRDLKWVG